MLQLVFSDQSCRQLKGCPRTADPDQQTVTAPESPHHPAEGANDPWSATSCSSVCVWRWRCPLHLFSPSHSTLCTLQTGLLINGLHLHIFFKKNYAQRGHTLQESGTYFLRQALLFWKFASYTLWWACWSGCSSTGKALCRGLLFLAAELVWRTERCHHCSDNLQHNIYSVYQFYFKRLHFRIIWQFWQRWWILF